MRTRILIGKDVVYEGEADMVVLPGLDGEFSVLDFHQPFLYRLRNGILKIIPVEIVSGEVGINRKKMDEKQFPVKDGLAKFSSNSLLILCEAPT